jgi:hypothetical protein
MNKTASKSVKPFLRYSRLIGFTRDENLSIWDRFAIVEFEIFCTGPVGFNL